MSYISYMYEGPKINLEWINWEQIKENLRALTFRDSCTGILGLLFLPSVSKSTLFWLKQETKQTILTFYPHSYIFDVQSNCTYLAFWNHTLNTVDTSSQIKIWSVLETQGFAKGPRHASISLAFSKSIFNFDHLSLLLNWIIPWNVFNFEELIVTWHSIPSVFCIKEEEKEHMHAYFGHAWSIIFIKSYHIHLIRAISKSFPFVSKAKNLEIKV